ncbi:MAG: CRISPR-associated endonuclease Cas3'' [Acidilobaceae archaeon]
MERDASRWPLAYEGVGLSEHLARVAVLAAVLFEEDLRVLSRRTGLSELDAVLVSSALLHDTGKALRYYYSRWRSGRGEGGGLKFPFHEVVSALVVYFSARGADANTLERLTLVSKIVARHHAAMHCRHPKDIAESRPGSGPCSDRLKELEDVLARAGDSESIEHMRRALSDALGMLESHLEHRGELVEKVSTLVEPVVSKLSTAAQIVESEREHVRRVLADLEKSIPPVLSLSGMLIVADNLAAGLCEPRDPSSLPVYTVYWRSELKRRILESRGVLEELCPRLLQE